MHIRAVYNKHILNCIDDNAYIFSQRMLIQTCIRPTCLHYTEKMHKERSGSGVVHRTLDYENPSSNPVLRC